MAAFLLMLGLARLACSKVQELVDLNDWDELDANKVLGGGNTNQTKYCTLAAGKHWERK
jgi:hypothetical protein